MIEGYSIDVDAGLLRSKDRGVPAQRRVFSSMPQTVKCKFTLTIREWGYWQEWFRRDGLSWFWIDLPSMYAGLNARRTFPHLVRLMSPITIDAKSSTHFVASVVLDMAPSNYKQFLAST
jgi:hypothetical protein